MNYPKVQPHAQSPNNPYSRGLDDRWAGITAVSGIAGIISYVIVLAAGHSDTYAVALAFIFAFGISVSSIGLYHVLGSAKGSRLALIVAVANVVGAALLLAMIMVQASVWAVVDQPDAALKAVWWGLDVAWDLYIGTGTVLFALGMFRRRGFGAWLGVPGLQVSLWYLAVYVRMGAASFSLKKQQLRSTAGQST